MSIDTHAPGGWRVTADGSSSWRQYRDGNDYWTCYQAENGARVFIANDEHAHARGRPHLRAGEIEVSPAGSGGPLIVRSDGSVSDDRGQWTQDGRWWRHNKAEGSVSSSTGVVTVSPSGEVRVWPCDGTDMLRIHRMTAPAAAPEPGETDLQLVDRLLREEAVNRGWCLEFETFVARVNNLAGHDVLSPRSQTYEATLSIVFNFEASRNGDARAEADVIRLAVQEWLGGEDFARNITNVTTTTSGTRRI
jgi:hypothetical protein